MTENNNDEPPKLSVKTPWGKLVKSKAYEDQFLVLTNEIASLTKRINDLEKQKPITDASLPKLSFNHSSQPPNDKKINELEQRLTSIETELQEVKTKLAQIKEKFAILGQEIMKKMS